MPSKKKNPVKKRPDKISFNEKLSKEDKVKTEKQEIDWPSDIFPYSSEPVIDDSEYGILMTDTKKKREELSRLLKKKQKSTYDHIEINQLKKELTEISKWRAGFIGNKPAWINPKAQIEPHQNKIPWNDKKIDTHIESFQNTPIVGYPDHHIEKQGSGSESESFEEDPKNRKNHSDSKKSDSLSEYPFLQTNGNKSIENSDLNKQNPQEESYEKIIRELPYYSQKYADQEYADYEDIKQARKKSIGELTESLQNHVVSARYQYAHNINPLSAMHDINNTLSCIINKVKSNTRYLKTITNKNTMKKALDGLSETFEQIEASLTLTTDLKQHAEDVYSKAYDIADEMDILDQSCQDITTNYKNIFEGLKRDIDRLGIDDESYLIQQDKILSCIHDLSVSIGRNEEEYFSSPSISPPSSPLPEKINRDKIDKKPSFPNHTMTRTTSKSSQYTFEDMTKDKTKNEREQDSYGSPFI